MRELDNATDVPTNNCTQEQTTRDKQIQVHSTPSRVINSCQLLFSTFLFLLHTKRKNNGINAIMHYLPLNWRVEFKEISWNAR